MAYTLHRLAPGAYDLALDGRVIGGVVRNLSMHGEATNWRAELLDDTPTARPAPFQRGEHVFGSWSATLSWLGDPIVTEEG